MLVEKYFDKEGEPGTVRLQYLALRPKGGKDKIKGLFLVPNVHFGPFKTAGSAALAERIYHKFQNIPGLAVFHTTVTHGENLTQNIFNSTICAQIGEDLENIEFKAPKTTQFKRILHGKTKILGLDIDNHPLLFVTRHPYPTDDMMPEIGEKIEIEAKNKTYDPPFIIDCHNALEGDEILITGDNEDGEEIIAASEIFLDTLKGLDSSTGELFYGCARSSTKFNPKAGIGAGGIICHYFRIGRQKTVIVHVDANNALLNVRSDIVNLGENKGLDRIELTTSDTHNVVRVISSRGYHPLGEKITSSYLIRQIAPLIDEAEANLEPVSVGIYESQTSGFTFWGKNSFFDLIIETIQRCLKVSKTLLSIGILVPAFLSLLLLLFFYNVPAPI